MAPPGRQSISNPHSVSLKVLRLSAPSLAVSEPIPCSGPEQAPIQRASLAHPAQPLNPFPLTPLLTLPPSFGAAYVGESFACTLCANNELPPSTPDHPQPIEIINVDVKAELQTPSTSQRGSGEGLALTLLPSAPSEDDSRILAPGRSAQRILRHDLAEEGPHVLAVTVAYAERRADGAGPERARTFRKLYQFAAQQAVGVRTKIGELKGGGGGGRRRFVVEAQIENLTEQTVVLDDVALELGAGLESMDLSAGSGKKTVLAQGDVQQVAFRLEQLEGQEVRVEAGRFVLAQLRVDWRMGMGQDGTLRTGWLGCMRRD